MSEERQEPGSISSESKGRGEQAVPATAPPPHHLRDHPSDFEDGSIALHDLLVVLGKRKKLILGIPVLAALIAGGVSFLMPNIFTAQAVIMPPQQQQSATAAMLGQLGAMVGVGGSNLGLRSSNDVYVGILKSRTVADALIKRFDLQKSYEETTMVETRNELSGNANISLGKDGLIAIEVDDRDPQRAAAIANGYVDELGKLTSTLAVSEAAQRRLFFERQLKQAKRELAQAENAFQKTQEKTGLVQIDQQGKAMIEAVATLRAQIVGREVELASIRSYATASNPEYVKVKEELSSLRRELKKLEGGSGIGSDMLVPTKEIPAYALEYARRYRDVKYEETIVELMAKQYELAKIDEARDAALIQVVDVAVAPDRKSKPHRALIVLLAGILSGLLAIVVAMLLEIKERRVV